MDSGFHDAFTARQSSSSIVRRKVSYDAHALDRATVGRQGDLGRISAPAAARRLAAEQQSCVHYLYIMLFNQWRRSYCTLTWIFSYGVARALHFTAPPCQHRGCSYRL